MNHSITQVKTDYGSNIACYSDFVVSEVTVKFREVGGAGATVIETFPPSLLLSHTSII